jgi:hypothetical protein
MATVAKTKKRTPTATMFLTRLTVSANRALLARKAQLVPPALLAKMVRQVRKVPLAPPARPARPA